MEGGERGGGEGRRDGRGGGGETKDGKEKIKQKMITNKTEPNQREVEPKRSGCQPKVRWTGGDGGREGWPRTLRSAPRAAPARHAGGPGGVAVTSACVRHLPCTGHGARGIAEEQEEHLSVEPLLCARQRQGRHRRTVNGLVYGTPTVCQAPCQILAIKAHLSGTYCVLGIVLSFI